MKSILLFFFFSFTLFAQSGWKLAQNDTVPNHNIQFVSENVGWGYITTDYLPKLFKTTNGGNTWNPSETPPPSGSCMISLPKSFFVNENVGYYRDICRHLHKTIDGGISWTGNYLCNSPNERIREFYFCNNNIGILEIGFASFSHFEVTVNGGENWIRKNIIINEHYRFPIKNYCITSDSIIWVSSMESKLFKSFALDTVWVNLTSSLPDLGTMEIDKIQFINKNVGYFLAIESSASAIKDGSLFKTIDGGENWNNVGDFSIYNNNYYLKFFSEQSGDIASGPWIRKTEDGGNSFDLVNENSNVDATTLCFVNTNVGFAMDHHKSIYKTVNSGLTWQYISGPEFYTFYVPTDYPIIQDAIDAADSGDVVIIEEGIYFQQFRYHGKAITVGSRYLLDQDTSHISKTIIDGTNFGFADSASLVYFWNGEDSSSVLCGLTLQNGLGTYEQGFGSDWRGGGAISILNSGATIRRNIIKNNSCISPAFFNLGGGIDCFDVPEDKTIIIEENTLLNNDISGGERSFGGAIECEAISGPLYIRKNKIVGNYVSASAQGNGGGICVLYSHSDDIKITNNFIHNNTLEGQGNNPGGGIFAMNLKVEISNNLITNNRCLVTNNGFGGGICVGYWPDDPAPIMKAVIVNNTVTNNHAKNYGGGIYSTNIETELMNNIVRDNEAPQGAQLRFNNMSITPIVMFSDIEGGYSGTGNIDKDPLFCNATFCFLTNGSSPCIDAGNPDAQYLDVPNPGNPFQALYPALGNTRNDMGAYGGPNSEWGDWSFPLPVELTTFTAQLNGSKVLLNWKTATELNNHGFEIQRNVNMSGWNVIGFIEGAGTTAEEQSYTFIDDIEYLSNVTMSYRLKQLDFGGTFEYSKIVKITNFATSYELSQNYPNPFNPSTIIKYQLAGKAKVQLKVYGVLGTEITTLVNEEKDPGSYKVELNAANLPSGVYFYKLQAGEFTATKKMLLVK